MALTSKKRRKEFRRAAKDEFRQVLTNLERRLLFHFNGFSFKAKSNIVAQFLSKEWWKSCLKLGLMITFYFGSSVALTFYQKQLIVVTDS